MKIADVRVLHCDAGWRPWSFVKLTTDDGRVGWSECTDSGGSPLGLAGVVETLAPLLAGKDARPVERRMWELVSATRQSPGGVVQKALGGIENALLDLKGKALGVPVHELYGGPVRDDVELYWSHCGTSRVRAHEVVGQKQVRTPDDLAELGREVVERGYRACKTNILVLGDQPFVYMPGFNKSPGGPDRIPDREVTAALVRSVAAFRTHLPDDFQLLVDLNFNFRAEGMKRATRALEPFDLGWAEIDMYHPRALREVKDATTLTVCSGENLYGPRDHLPFIEARAMDVVSVDVPWNGFAQSLRIAQLADAHELAVTPHNYYSHLATFMSAQFCAALTNVRLMEFDVDDVPWRDELASAQPAIAGGRMRIPDAPGWGCDVNEDVLAEHPWPRPA